MGGKGTYAIGNNVTFRYKTIDVIEGVKVLRKIDERASGALPEESHSSNCYILLDKNGVFRQMRFYYENHEAIFEIGYHQEKSLGSGKVLHIHLYQCPGELDHKKGQKFVIGPGNEYYEKFKKYFRGVEL